MAIDTWFPLAIYYDDLPEHLEYQEQFVSRIRKLHDDSGAKRSQDSASWTGDIHKVAQIHNDPAFDWLTHNIQKHALVYLKNLGISLNKVDVYIQRSWPIIAKPGQRISQHTHPNANLSAVYYVSVPKEGDSGKTRFFNELRYNELITGLGSEMTEGYSNYNALNYNYTSYQAVEGRALFFPSKQLHDVEENKTNEDRISISFDLVITAKADPNLNAPEFLMPSPQTWKKFDDGALNELIDWLETKAAKK